MGCVGGSAKPSTSSNSAPFLFTDVSLRIGSTDAAGNAKEIIEHSTPKKQLLDCEIWLTSGYMIHQVADCAGL